MGIKQSSLLVSQNAVPLSASQFEKLMELISHWNKKEITDFLFDHVSEISKTSFLQMFESAYGAEEIIALVDKWHTKCSYDSEIIEKVCTELLRYDADKLIDFVREYKQIISPSIVLKQIRSKNVRNRIREIYNMPKEFIEDRLPGIEIFGKFVPLTEITTSRTVYEHDNGASKITFSMNLEESGNVKYSLSEASNSGFSQTSSGIDMKEVWILDKDGYLYME
jgi:hypothetical protein